MLYLLLSIAILCGTGSASPQSCTAGTPVTIGGISYKTKVFIVKHGEAGAPSVSSNNTNISASVVGTLEGTGATFWNSSSPPVAPGTSHPSWFPYQFVLPPKAGHLIVGFDVGSAGMKEGEVRELCIPPEEGYGNKVSRPGIPRGSTLVFTLTCGKVTPPQTTARAATGATTATTATPPRGCVAPHDKEPWCDRNLKSAQRAELVVKALTVPELVGMMDGDAPAIDRLGIPAYHYGFERCVTVEQVALIVLLLLLLLFAVMQAFD